jgi:HK97 gp10 family phage protein
MKTKVSVSGLPALRNRFGRIPAHVLDASATELVAGAQKVVSMARALVPVESGHLRDTIRHTEPRVDKRGRLYVAIMAGDESTVTDGPSGRFQIARLVEFGTRRRAAEPFLFPSYRANRRGWRAAITKAVAKAWAAS